jgi:hypothetical protein
MLTCENNSNDANGPFFIPPDFTLDHSPFHRGPWEDWGWMHDMTTLAPADANGILSASLTIRAWDVQANETVAPEFDDIYAIGVNGPGHAAIPIVRFHTDDGVIALPGTFLGRLQDTGYYSFGTTVLQLPDQVLADLLRDRGLRVFMNIDSLQGMVGRRVTLIYSALTVNYAVPHTAWEPNQPVYQFWSPQLSQHFWTMNEAEKNKLLTKFPSIWTYEGIVHHTYKDKRDDTVFPVYRFWSLKTMSHFYTMKESERDKLMAYCPHDEAVSTGLPSTWIYEGIAFYAQAEGHQTKEAMPVYRFWSASLHRHLFTTDETERQQADSQPGLWKYEGIAWYVYR